MKIIDLLNKIANGEIPKHIKMNSLDFFWNNDEYAYDIKGANIYAPYYTFKFDELNDEVEIIEEDKKIPEKIEEVEIEVSMAIGEQICANKINEIIDYLQNKGE